MANIILGKSNCSLCGEILNSTADAVGFPAFLPAGHALAPYSDAAFHRNCFIAWDEHDEFQRLYDEYLRVWSSRPQDLSYKHAEKWGKSAFARVFEKRDGAS
jgi:hypothetical protein